MQGGGNFGCPDGTAIGPSRHPSRRYLRRGLKLGGLSQTSLLLTASDAGGGGYDQTEKAEAVQKMVLTATQWLRELINKKPATF